MSFYVKNHILIGVAVEQFIGREAETATFLSRCLLPFGLRVAGFRPRHLNRYTPAKNAENNC